MANPFKNFGNLPSKTKRLLALGVVLALFAALPLFLWAILTQRFDIRRKAVSGEPTPPPTLTWRTQYATLSATNFRISVNGKDFYDNNGSVDVKSSPGNNNYTTLESTWRENDVEMRMYIYFRNDGETWWADEIRIFDGKPYPERDWITFSEKSFEAPLGQAFTQNTPGGFVQMDSNTGKPIAEIYYDSIRVEAFTERFRRSPFPTPSPTTTPFPGTPSPTPTPTQGSHILDFKLRFSGVDDGSAEGTSLVLYFENPALNVFKQTSPVEATHIDDGVYQVLVDIPTTEVPVGGGYSIS